MSDELFEWGAGEASRRARDKGIKRVLSHTPEAYRAAFRAAVDQLAYDPFELDAEDVRAIVGDPPNHHNAFSANMWVAIRRGIIYKVGHTKCKREDSHARELPRYRGTKWGPAPE